MAHDPVDGRRLVIRAAAFVRDNTRLSIPILVPELRLHLADEALPLWQRTEAELERDGLPPPYWAFAWAGGQALARFVLDKPDLVQGRTVLDVGAGCGIVAIACARAGAFAITANEVDEFALAAIEHNASANGVDVTIADGDLLSGEPEADVVCAADLFYERDLAERVFAFLKRAAVAGRTVLIGDPKRSYLPVDRLQPLATYQVPVSQALEDADVKSASVWTLAVPCRDSGAT